MLSVQMTENMSTWIPALVSWYLLLIGNLDQSLLIRLFYKQQIAIITKQLSPGKNYVILARSTATSGLLCHSTNCGASWQMVERPGLTSIVGVSVDYTTKLLL